MEYKTLIMVSKFQNWDLVFGKFSTKLSVKKSVEDALEVGYRLIDTAALYKTKKPLVKLSKLLVSNEKRFSSLQKLGLISLAMTKPKKLLKKVLKNSVLITLTSISFINHMVIHTVPGVPWPTFIKKVAFEQLVFPISQLDASLILP